MDPKVIFNLTIWKKKSFGPFAFPLTAKDIQFFLSVVILDRNESVDIHRWLHIYVCMYARRFRVGFDTTES